MKKQKLTALIIILILISIIFTGCLAKPNTSLYNGKNEEDKALKFLPLLNFDGKENYRILQMTDIQFVESEIAEKSIAVMDKLISESKPNLIVITGDIASTEMFLNDVDAVKALNYAVRDYFDSKKIAWTLVFGNHDGLMADVNGINFKQYIFNECYKTAEYFVGGDATFGKNTESVENRIKNDDICEVYYGDDNPEVSDQYFNFSIFIKDGEKIIFDILGLDTGTCANAASNNGTYVALTEKQADFYKNSAIIKQDGTKAEDLSEAVPVLLFTHQPLNLYNTMYLNRNRTDKVEIYSGSIGDAKSQSAPNGICSPMKGFEAFENVMIEHKTIKGVFVGHDHLNTLAGIYKVDEDYKVLLAYGRISSYGMPFYPNTQYIRGGRVIDLNKNGTFTTSDARCEFKEMNGEKFVFGYEETDCI